MKPLQSIGLILFLFVCLQETVAQTMARIENTNIALDNDRIIVTYDLTGTKSGEKFDVWLKITDSGGNLVQGRNFSGDIGKNVEAGKGRVIYWDFEKDQIDLNDEINIQVMAEAIKARKLTYGKAFAMSVLVPGWGLAGMEKKKGYFLTGLAGYGALALSAVYASRSENTYSDYDASNAIGERESLYDDYVSQRNMAEVFAWTAATIWVADIAWMSLRFSKYKQNNELGASPRISLGYTYCLASRTPGMALKFKF